MSGEATAGERLSAFLQGLLPTRALSAGMFRLASIRNPRFKNALIRAFLKRYAVDLGEAESSRPEDYEHFNAFFTRALKPGLRPLPDAAQALVSPVDGAISQAGPIREGALLQAKGHDYSAAELLAEADLAAEFYNGSFATIYLAPHNYHRVHMPCAGRLRTWAYVPGRLFSVNPATARAVPGLFSRNERMAAVFDTEFGPLAVADGGALLVGGIETVFARLAHTSHRRERRVVYFEPGAAATLERGVELGRFHMGSTVILPEPRGGLAWDEDAVAAGRPVRLGEELAKIFKSGR